MGIDVRGSPRRHWQRALACAVTAALRMADSHAEAAVDPAARLKAVRDDIARAPADNPFHRPLRIDSTETPDSVSGEAFGTVDVPFASLGSVLADPEHWCDVLVLHLNNKECRESTVDGQPTINLKVARKFDQTVDEATPIRFAYQLASATPQLLSVRLHAADGPMGTSDYRIVFEAIPTHDGHSFVHLAYSYRFGFTSRIGMDLYFATVGHGKVGFTEVGHEPNGQPAYIAGLRGLMERNTMRYLLAVESYMAAPGVGTDAYDKRAQHWFDATEQYPRQLHEVERQPYLDMKRKERGALTANSAR